MTKALTTHKKSVCRLLWDCSYQDPDHNVGSSPLAAPRGLKSLRYDLSGIHRELGKDSLWYVVFAEAGTAWTRASIRRIIHRHLAHQARLRPVSGRLTSNMIDTCSSNNAVQGRCHRVGVLYRLIFQRTEYLMKGGASATYNSSCCPPTPASMVLQICKAVY